MLDDELIELVGGEKKWTAARQIEVSNLAWCFAIFRLLNNRSNFMTCIPNICKATERIHVIIFQNLEAPSEMQQNNGNN